MNQVLSLMLFRKLISDGPQMGISGIVTHSRVDESVGSQREMSDKLDSWHKGVGGRGLDNDVGKGIREGLEREGVSDHFG